MSNTTVNIIIGFGSAAFGAVLGALIAWTLGSGDRARAKQALESQQRALDAQQRANDLQAQLAKAEEERDRIAAIGRFQPSVRITADGQALELEADDWFQVDSLDYLNESGAKVASQKVGIMDKKVHVPIDDSALVKVQNMGPWVNTYDRSAHVVFQFNLQKGEFRKQVRLTALVKPELVGSTMVRRVLG